MSWAVAARRVPGWARATLVGLGALAAPVPAVALALWADQALRGPGDYVTDVGVPTLFTHSTRGALAGLAAYSAAVAAQHYALLRLGRGHGVVPQLLGLLGAVLLGLALLIFL